MRRKRRNRSTWFPVLPTALEDTSEFATWTDYIDTIVAGQIFSPVSATPITLDFTELPNAATAGTSLRDVVEGQSFLLDRIVGSVFAKRIDENIQDVLACAALAVFPAADNGGADLNNSEGNPFNPDNSQQPWIFRRVWKLESTATLDVAIRPPVRTNMQYGSVKEGTHIDTKGSKRMIRREQRLFFVTAVSAINPVDAPINVQVHWTYDIRLIGKMVRQVNRSTFK